MSVKKKICLVIPSLTVGGMERVMSELATYFSSRLELEVHMVMYGIKPEFFYSIPSNISIHTPDFKFNNKFRLWFTIRTLFFLRKKVKSIKPDSILSFGEYWNNFVLIALYGLKFPVFVSDRCQPDKSLGKVHNTLRKILYSRAKGVIVQTQIAKKIYKEMLPRANIYVIGNPIREITGVNAAFKENIVLSVGRLINSKHHDELIKLFVKINAPDWKLFIVGGDAIKQHNMSKLRALINMLDAEDKVFLTGTRTDVDEFYKRSKIFALTSSSEGFPNVIGEAMSAGLPVIAFDCIAGPSELIQHEINGLLINLYDYDSFKNGLQRMIEDESTLQKFSLETKQVLKYYSREILFDKYFEVLFE